MKALVVYESMYGNTAAIGEAIAASLRAQRLDVTSGPISKTEPTAAAGVDLLVAGGPTHVHGMSSSKSRQTAADDTDNTYPDPIVAPGLRTWLKELSPGEGRLAAAFDTRIGRSILPTGSAAAIGAGPGRGFGRGA
jgi:flavodoxin